MRVKRYIVDSMPDALQRIRMELGKDAVILNTKEIKTGGFLGLFGKKRIEVIAATDTAAAAPKPKSVNPPTVIPQEPHVAPIIHAAAAVEASAAPFAVSVLEYPAEPAHLIKEPPALTDKSKEEVLINEVRQMKEMFMKFSSVGGAGALPEFMQQIETRLLEQEILPVIVGAVISKAVEELTGPPDQWTLQEAAKVVRGELLNILKHESHKTLQQETKVAHFVGPTGVGKTTTIAKLAAEQVLKYNRKVGFITSDTYRIAAVEQLKTYANILNVPLEVVFSPQEMNKAFKAFSDRDIIFMDTAGRNYRNEMYVSELNSLLKHGGQSETFLVLSLTSKYRDMKVITENFAKFKLDKVLYTKMDETESLGSIINLAYEFSLRGSYITNGQNVPDDIEELKEERIVDLIMGGIGHE